MTTGRTPALGLIVLRTDETIEGEFRRFLPPDAARLHITRIPSGDTVTPESLAEMETNLTQAAALLPPAAGFDVVGYGCTSGSAVMGPDVVAAQVSAGIATRAVTNPLSAALAQIAHLGCSRMGLVSPYTADVADRLRDVFAGHGLHFVKAVSFNECNEANVVRIDPAKTAQAARDLAQQAELDGVFLSCTNLPTAPILKPLQQELGIPVLSSNHALAWHMAHLAEMTALE